ncbi:MAG TPA: hypothetical protein VM661_02060 [Candidatus Sulfotelmatobacter sp.]|nr:hypothetical protein [Candidatus Sulfotelmatobacter sp.]
MIKPPRITHAMRLKVQLDQLCSEAEAAGLTLVAHLIGAASEAAADIIETQPVPLLRLVKTNRLP